MEKRDTKKEFITAFWKLYEIKPIEKISVSQLCKTAGYNRATFYNHFENIYDLLNKAVREILIPVKNSVLSIQNIRVLLQENLIGSILFACFQQQDKYIELLFKRQNYFVLGDQIKKEFLLLISADTENRTVNGETIEILLEYQISAVLGVINYWYQKGKPVSEQEILQKIYDISSKGVLESFKSELNGVKGLSRDARGI